MSKKRPDLVDVAVGSRIRAQRLLAGMSQTKLADALGITFQQVQKYEKGVNRVGASRLSQIAKMLDVPISSFFGEGEDLGDGTDTLLATSFLAMPGALDLLQAYAAIGDTKLRRSLIALARDIADVAQRIQA